MGCGSSKNTPVITNAMRIQIAPEQTPIDNVLFTKSTPLFSRSASEPNTAVITVGKPGVSVRPPSNPVRSPSSSSLALSLRRRLSADSRRARRSAASVISVEPRAKADVTQRQVSVCSRETADSGFLEESGAGSRRQEEEILEFLAEQVSCPTDTVRPVTPDLSIEGTNFQPPKQRSVFTPKHLHLPGSVETAQLTTTANILEKAPLPPIHNRIIKSFTFEEKSAQKKQIEQSFEVIERPPSRGGLAFDILMDVPTEKKRALIPIEFRSGDSKKGGKKIRSAAELEAKLAAAEERRNERDIISSLVEQREIDEKRVKEKQEKYQKSVENREATLGVRMRTMSNNRDAAISAIIMQAHKVLQKVENARNNRESENTS